MPRYMVERDFPQGLEIPTNVEGQKAMLGVVDNNATEQVTWVQSFVTDDHTKTFCIYDGPTPEATAMLAFGQTEGEGGTATAASMPAGSRASRAAARR